MMSAFKHALAVPTSVISLMLSSAEQAAAGEIGLQEFRSQMRQALDLRPSQKKEVA